MRLRLISDIHLDGRNKWKMPETPDDAIQVLCIAGDIGRADVKGQWFFKDAAKRFEKIFVVLGNHDFYNGNLYTAHEEWRNFFLQWDNVTLLNNTFEEYNGVTFYGTTLWTNFHNDPIAQVMAKGAMADYHYIEGQAGKVHPVEIEEQNKIAADFIKLAADHRAKRKVLMTHHMPHERFTVDRWRKRLYEKDNAYFFTTNLWIETLEEFDLVHCGHTHDQNIFTLGYIPTKCVVNPLGYGGEYTPNKGDPKLVVEI